MSAGNTEFTARQQLETEKDNTGSVLKQNKYRKRTPEQLNTWHQCWKPSEIFSTNQDTRLTSVIAEFSVVV